MPRDTAALYHRRNSSIKDKPWVKLERKEATMPTKLDLVSAGDERTLRRVVEHLAYPEPYTGVLLFTTKELEKYLGVTRQRVHQRINMLQKVDLVRKTRKRGVWCIDPDFGYYGYEEQARARWDECGRDN